MNDNADHEQIESARDLRCAKICTLAEEIFASEERAKAWLDKPRKLFKNQSATHVMQSESGARLVEEILNQLDSGYFA